MKALRFCRALTLILLSLLILATPAAGATGEERVILTLPETASVEGRTLILGEILEIEGPSELAAEVAAVNAGAAPSAGNSRLLTKGQIEVRLRQARLDLGLIEFQGAATVTVYGASQRAGQPSGEDMAETTNRIVVAARDLARGEIITAADLEYEERKSRTSSAVHSLEELIGLRTTRYIRSGTEMTLSGVEQIPAVDRGSPVQIIVHTEGVSVSAPGTARAAGALGEIIPVENSLSRKIIYGKIIAADTVEVDIRGSYAP